LKLTAEKIYTASMPPEKPVPQSQIVSFGIVSLYFRRIFRGLNPCIFLNYIIDKAINRAKWRDILTGAMPCFAVFGKSYGFQEG